MSQEISLSTSCLASAPCSSQLVFQIFTSCLQALFSPYITLGLQWHGASTGGQSERSEMSYPSPPKFAQLHFFLCVSIKRRCFHLHIYRYFTLSFQSPQLYPISKGLRVLPLAGQPLPHCLQTRQPSRLPVSLSHTLPFSPLMHPLSVYSLTSLEKHTHPCNFPHDQDIYHFLHPKTFLIALWMQYP